MNDSDFEILKYIGLNYTHSQMATQMNISESNIKYRMKRLEKITKTESRKDLLNLLIKNVPKLVNPKRYTKDINRSLGGYNIILTSL